MTEAYIYDALRTPRGKGRPDGALHEVTSVALSAKVLNAVKERNHLDGAAVEDVIWGNATQVGEQGGCLARSAVLLSDLDESIPGLSINRFCASGMEAVNLAANQVRAGAGEAYIAGGVEMMSRVAMGSDGAAVAADPSLAMKTYFVPQGISADIIATRYGFSRDEADALAVESQKRAAAAWAEGRFARSVVPVRDQNGVTILERDEYLRPNTDMQSLGALKPAFKEMGEQMPGFDKLALMKYPELERVEHIHHAGNSSGIVDGAAAVLIGSRAFGEAHGLRPRAHPRHREDRHRPYDHADGSGAGDPEDPARGRDADLGHRSLRGERGLRGGRAALPAGLRRGSRAREPERRRHRHGPPAGRDRRHHHRHAPRRTRAHRPLGGPRHALRGLGHGRRHHHRTRLREGHQMTDFTSRTDADGVCTITWDVPGKSMNVMSMAGFAELDGLIAAALGDPSVKGVILTSGKKDFCRGDGSQCHRPHEGRKAATIRPGPCSRA